MKIAHLAVCLTCFLATASTAQGMGDSVCVALGYRIQPDGSTSDVAVIHNWTSNDKAANQNVEYLDPYARARHLR